MIRGEMLRANIAGRELPVSEAAEHVPGFGAPEPRFQGETRDRLGIGQGEKLYRNGVIEDLRARRRLRITQFRNSHGGADKKAQ